MEGDCPFCDEHCKATDDGHCMHWWENEGCCRCGAGPCPNVNVEGEHA